MAVALEFIDFIVPISIIKEKYPGGWEQCLKDYNHLIGGRVWHDDYLLRDGGMGPGDIQYLVEHWKKLGFEPMGQRNGKPFWKDACVVESMFGGPTLPCDWLEIDTDGGSAYLRGTDPGPIAGRR